MFNPSVEIIDLKNKWVIFKRIKKQNWYHRGRNYQVCSRRATKAALYNTHAEAVAEQTRLNTNRKSYRFRVETADKHFVSNWSIQYQTWRNEVIVTNNPIGFESLVSKNVNICHDLNQTKTKVRETIETEMARQSQRLTDIETRYQETLKRAENERQEAITNINNLTLKLRAARLWIESTDLNQEFVEKYQTNMDKKAYILFGRNDVNVKTKT